MCFIFSFIDNPTIKQIYIHVHVADKWVHNNLLKFSYFYIQGTAIGQVWIKWGKGGEFRQILNFFFLFAFKRLHLPFQKWGICLHCATALQGTLICVLKLDVIFKLPLIWKLDNVYTLLWISPCVLW
jgi:hypothetical protein